MSAHGHALRLKNQRDVNQALSGLPVPSFVFDLATGQILACNEHFGTLLGYPCAELLMLNVESIQPDDHIAHCHTARTQAPPQGLVRWQYRCKDGAHLNVKVHYREVEYLSDTGSTISARFVVVEFWDRAEHLHPH